MPLSVFTAEATLEGDRVRVSTASSELLIGMMGGNDPTPEEIFMASALSCMMLTVKYYADRLGVKIESMNGYIEGELDPKGFTGESPSPPGFIKVTYHLKVRARGEKLDDVMKASERMCPLKDTLSRSVPVEVKWEI